MSCLFTYTTQQHAKLVHVCQITILSDLSGQMSGSYKKIIITSAVRRSWYVIKSSYYEVSMVYIMICACGLKHYYEATVFVINFSGNIIMCRAPTCLITQGTYIYTDESISILDAGDKIHSGVNIKILLLTYVL